MAGLMESFGFMPPGMSPYGSLGGMPGGYQPDPQTLMLQQQLQRSGQNGPGPLPMPPGMVSPYAFAPRGAAGPMPGFGMGSQPAFAGGYASAIGQDALNPNGPASPSSAPMPMADVPAPQAANAGPAPAPSAVMAAAGNSGFPMPPDGRSQSSIERQRRLAESLMQQGMSSAPIGHWTQGGARLVQALSGSILNNRAEADEKTNQKANREFLANLLGGGGNFQQGAAATPGNNPAQQAITRTAGPAKSGPQTVETAGRLMSDLQRDFGLTPQQAAGVAGNLAHESGGFRTLQEIRPTVPGSRGGFGYAQWTGPRRVQFENWSRQNGLDPTSYEANYGFLKHELQNTGEGRVLGALRQAPDVGSATQIFSNQFLRPGVPAMGSRMAFAQQFGNLAGQQGAPAPQAPAQPGAPQTPAPAMGGAPMPQQQQGIAPRAPGIAGMDPQRLLLAAAFTNDPNMKQTLGALAQMQAQQGKVQYQTLPDGTILALDPSGRRPPTPVFQAPQKPIALGENQRLVNPQTGQVIGGQPETPQTFTTPDGRTVPLPTDKKAREEFLKTAGKEGAQAVLNAPAAIESANNALAVIGQITGPRNAQTGAFDKPHAGMKNVVGTTWQYLPSMPGGDAANFDAIMEQVKGGTFLRAFESLKGGGAITNVEGEKATAAIARLNTKQSVPEFMKAVGELREIIERGKQRLERVNRGGAPAPAQQLPGGWSVEKVN